MQPLLARIYERLSALSASQRIALGLGVVLVAVSLAWMVQWAARSEMSPLWKGSLSPEELASIRAGLDQMNEPYEARGDTIYVRAGASQAAILAQLQQMDRMPSDLAGGFAALVKDSNPWLSQAENDRRWTVALQRELETVLRNFAGVGNARVFLNLNAERRGFSRTAPPSSASVTLVMKNKEPVGEALAKAAARLVAGAVRGLALENVSVVDANGNSALEWESREIAGGKLQRERLDQEKTIRDKIRSQLAFDPNLLVNVRVELNYSTQTVESQTVEEPVEVSEESTTEQRVRSKPAPSPGVQANVGVAVAGSGSDEQFTRETSRTEKQAGFTRTTRSTPSGETFAIYAAINISHSYLESVFKRFNPDAQQPTLEQIEQVFEQERKRVVDQVSKLVKAQDDRNVAEQIAVNWYYDPQGEAVTATAAGGFDQALELAQRYAPQAGLGLLALLALFMMLRLARRPDAAESFGLELGLPKEAIDAAQKAAADVARVSAKPRMLNQAIARAAAPEEASLPSTSATEGVLMAQEVDEAMVQVQKMIQEVDEMVKADPDSVSTLFEQWIDRNDKFGP